MKTLVVKVTQQHIDDGAGERGICSVGPINRAIRDALGMTQVTAQTASRFDCMVQPTRLFASGRRGCIKCDTTPDLSRRIVEWEERGTMEPFEFSVEVKPTNDEPPSKLFAYLVPGWDAPQIRVAVRK